MKHCTFINRCVLMTRRELPYLTNFGAQAAPDPAQNDFVPMGVCFPAFLDLLQNRRPSPLPNSTRVASLGFSGNYAGTSVVSMLPSSCRGMVGLFIPCGTQTIGNILVHSSLLSNKHSGELTHLYIQCVSHSNTDSFYPPTAPQTHRRKGTHNVPSHERVRDLFVRSHRYDCFKSTTVSRFVI